MNGFDFNFTMKHFVEHYNSIAEASKKCSTMFYLGFEFSTVWKTHIPTSHMHLFPA